MFLVDTGFLLVWFWVRCIMTGFTACICGVTNVVWVSLTWYIDKGPIVLVGKCKSRRSLQSFYLQRRMMILTNEVSYASIRVLLGGSITDFISFPPVFLV